MVALAVFVLFLLLPLWSLDSSAGAAREHSTSTVSAPPASAAGRVNKSQHRAQQHFGKVKMQQVRQPKLRGRTSTRKSQLTTTRKSTSSKQSAYRTTAVDIQQFNYVKYRKNTGGRSSKSRIISNSNHAVLQPSVPAKVPLTTRSKVLSTTLSDEYYYDDDAPTTTPSTPAKQTTLKAKANNGSEDSNESSLDHDQTEKFKENMDKAMLLNGNHEIPTSLFRCLPRSVLDQTNDCEDDTYFYTVSKKLLMPVENYTLKLDLFMLEQLQAKLQQVNFTWPEGFKFERDKLSARLEQVIAEADKLKKDENEDKIILVQYYKIVQELFQPLKGAKRKPDDVFVTDIVQVLAVKMGNVFLKRFLFEYVFHTLLYGSFKGEEREVT